MVKAGYGKTCRHFDVKNCFRIGMCLRNDGACESLYGSVASSTGIDHPSSTLKTNDPMKTHIASASLAMMLLIAIPTHSAAENPRINPFSTGLECLSNCIKTTTVDTIYRDACVADCYFNFLADLIKVFTR
jgi:hypothetical protein